MADELDDSNQAAPAGSGQEQAASKQPEEPAAAQPTPQPEAEVEAPLEDKAPAKHAVPEVANKSDYVEPGSWQAEVRQKGLDRMKDSDTPEALAAQRGKAAAAKPKATAANTVPVDEADILAAEKREEADYQETDVFAFANNLVQFKDELKVELFLFNKNYVVYRTSRSSALDKQLEPIFVDAMLEYILEGAEQGLIVRGFEAAEAESNVLQRTRVYKVDKLREVLGWLKTQDHEIELFVEEEHDMKRIKGVIARITHAEMRQPFYVIKALPQSQVMKGGKSASAGWMIRDNKFVPFDADAALRIPADNQLLVLEGDLYVFSEPKLKALFGYDAKESSIAESKIREIEANFKLSFSEGQDMQSLIKGKKAAIKKLQKIEPGTVKQEDLMDRSDELGVGLMADDDGRIIIMDDKDVVRFVNLLNDDYMESPMTGLRYEVIKKRELKPPDEEELLKQVGA